MLTLIEQMSIRASSLPVVDDSDWDIVRVVLNLFPSARCAFEMSS